MSQDFLTFRRFDDLFQARELTLFLERRSIAYCIEDASPAFDVSFAHNVFERQIHIKLKASDFERVERLLIEEHIVGEDDIPADYYLMSFSNKELSDILVKPDEWSATDYNTALQLLKERGIEIEPEFLTVLRKQRNKTLAEPEKSHRGLVALGYLVAFLGGFLGVFIGWHLLTFKKTLPDGMRVYGYVFADRKKGRNILVFSLISVLIWLGLLVREFNKNLILFSESMSSYGREWVCTTLKHQDYYGKPTAGHAKTAYWERVSS